MDLKHLIITAIVANAAKSGWEVTDGKSTAAYPRSYRGREAVRRGFRHFTKPWFRTRYEDWKRANATARIAGLSPFPCRWSASAAVARPTRRMLRKHEALVFSERELPRGIAINANPLRIQRTAAPELSGIRVGWRCTDVGSRSTAFCRCAACMAATGKTGPAQIPEGCPRATSDSSS